MIRERFAVNDNGACGTGSSPGENCSDGGNWNSYCGACHYYYGGQHAGMSCGNASCHEANSLHRIIKVTGSGGTQLRLTQAGYENDYQRPDFTPEMIDVDGHIGSYDLTVTFDDGVWANIDLSGSLEPEEFWMFDANSDNPRTITNITHTAGDSTATLTMSAPLVEADLSSDTLALRPTSVWHSYDGGYVNAATGTIPAQVVSGGPWPVAITEVTFSEGVYSSPGAIGDLDQFDFNFTDTNIDGAASIISVSHTAGAATAIITLNTNLITTDIGSDTLAALSNVIFDAYDNIVGTTAVTITAMADAPSISTVQGVDGHNKLAVWFSERVYANAFADGALQHDDFIFTATGKNIINVEHIPEKITATLTLNNPIAASDINNVSVTLAAADSSIYDIEGYPAHSNETVVLTDAVVSSITQVEGVVGSNKLKVTFESQVYAIDNGTGDLQPSDFILTDADNSRTVCSVFHSGGSNTAILTLKNSLCDTDAPLDAIDDIGTDTLAAVSDSIFGPGSGYFPVGTDPVTITGQTAPSITKGEGAEGFDQLFVSFTEGVYAESDATGSLQPADFTFIDTNIDGAESILSVSHTAGDAAAIITLNTNLITTDIGGDTLAAVSNGIFNIIGNPVGTTAVAITGNGCPTWGASFPIENETQFSATIMDSTGLVTGIVGNPTFAFPDPLDNDVFNGAEDQGTYINLSNSACFNSTRAITVEARVKPTEVDRGVDDNTQGCG
jgi:hypothetical protein